MSALGGKEGGALDGEAEVERRRAGRWVLLLLHRRGCTLRSKPAWRAGGGRTRSSSSSSSWAAPKNGKQENPDKRPLTAEHEGDVEEGVHGVGGGVGQRLGGRDVVDEAAHGVHLARELIRLVDRGTV